MQRLFITGCLLFLSFYLAAQQFGGNPPSLKWQQINTDSVRIIFPAGMDSQANRVASVIHYMAAKSPARVGSLSLGKQFKKINIVLQNQTTVANGYVQLGPFRSEFFLTPAANNFDLGSISWPDQLALHEYRHVQQFNNFNNGLSKTMKFLFGEEGFALAINAAVPDWFFEGDAVYNETFFSGQGRGRLPLFMNAYPSLWLEGKNYSWMKLRNGSLKDYVPNHYYLGYLLVNYGRTKYGADFWTKVTTDASAFKGLFYPFQKAVKKYAGTDYKTFREQAFEYYRKELQGSMEAAENRKAEAGPVKTNKPEKVFSVNKKFITNYYFPYQVSSDSLLYLKTSYRQRPAFYIKDSAGEHKLRTRDIAIDEQFSYRNGKIVYSAYENDARWSWRDYGVIKVLDLATGQQQTLTHKTKYFTPDISSDGLKVAAVQVAADGKSELHVLDAGNGQLMKAIRSAEITLFTDPKFIDDNSIVTAVRLIDGKMALATAEINTGNLLRLTPPSYNVVGYPCVSNGMIYFTASYAGNDDVFVIRLSDKKLFKITNGPVGSYFVNAAAGKITWSAFTADGYQLQQMNESDMLWTEVKENDIERLKTRFDISDQPVDWLAGAVEQRKFPVTKYKKGTKLLNFHSWRPYYSDPEFTYSVYGENVLNTLQTELYYLYNENEKTSAVGLSAVYGAWFPYLSLGTEYTFNREASTGNRTRQWDQLDSRIGLSIPLSSTSGQTFKNFSIASNYVLRNEYNKGLYKDTVGNSSFSYLSHSISWSQQVQRAVQHIYPRFGYALSMAHRHPITLYKGYQLFGNSSLYVPGFLSTHNILLTGSFQQRDTTLALFSTRFANARGFSDYYRTNAGSRMWKLSANYHLPLLYPDWGFGNILYLQRVRANLFYDQQRLYFNDKKNTIDLRSTGFELFADTKWWNQYPLTFGIRFSFLLDDDPRSTNRKGTSIFEFVLPVNIIPR